VTPKPQASFCPNCGGSIELRGFGQSLSAVCVQCLSILDTKTPTLTILQQFQARERILPLIPLGKRGKLHGGEYEVIGFQVREILVDSVAYQWHEYVLFNPFKGFRYLTQYDGHWTDVKPIKAIPEKTTKSGKKAVRYLGSTYSHFQSATASTVYVLGEFPWRVRVGETNQVEDYVSPPRMLSSEATEGEEVWSLGEYKDGSEIWRAFKIGGSPPKPVGVYANQPSPHSGKPTESWILGLILVSLLLFTMLLARVFMFNREVFQQDYTYFPGDRGEASFVTPIFDVPGRTSNVEVKVTTNVENAWIFFNLALINDDTGEARDWGREISYYRGRDSDGNWSEGSTSDSTILPSVPAGRYYLRVEPEWSPDGSTTMQVAKNIQYSLMVRRDVTILWPYLVAVPLLLLPALFRTIQYWGFEQKRWQESDYSGGGGEDD